MSVVRVEGIKLGEHGWLRILRNNSWVSQYCPVAGDTCHCGTWCPLCSDIYQERVSSKQVNTCIHLCQDRILVVPKTED